MNAQPFFSIAALFFAASNPLFSQVKSGGTAVDALPQVVPSVPGKVTAGSVVEAVPDAKGDIVNQVSTSDHLSMLFSILKSTGLDSVLNGPGPFTLLAPSNDAFKKLPQGEIDRLMLPENRDQLISILNFHVLPFTLTSDDFRPGSYKTVQGESIDVVSVGNDGVTIGGARLSQADVRATNGMIHVIDTVLMPPAAEKITK